MISKELIDQINHLYHKSKTVGLDEAEKLEQARLRQEYLKGVRAQVRNTLDNVKFVEPEHTNCSDSNCGCGHTHKHK